MNGSWINPVTNPDRQWNKCFQMKGTEFGTDDMLPDAGSKPYPNVIWPGYDELCPATESQMEIDLETKSDFDVKVDNLKTNYGTGTAIGLEWATRTLSPNWANFFGVYSAPWNDPEKHPKYLVLMSDGGADHVFRAGDQTGQSNTFATNATVQVCNFLKSKGVTVFTISYEMGGFAPTFPGLVALKSCASPGLAFDASASNIGDVLAVIGANIQSGSVRLTN